VLILAELRLASDDMEGKQSLEQSWHQCLSILSGFSADHDTADKCAKTLVKVREKAIASQAGKHHV
jgi:hypothetical protein